MRLLRAASDGAASASASVFSRGASNATAASAAPGVLVTSFGLASAADPAGDPAAPADPAATDEPPSSPRPAVPRPGLPAPDPPAPFVPVVDASTEHPAPKSATDTATSRQLHQERIG